MPIETEGNLPLGKEANFLITSLPARMAAASGEGKRRGELARTFFSNRLNPQTQRKVLALGIG
jgi:hypothetical protein